MRKNQRTIALLLALLALMLFFVQGCGIDSQSSNSNSYASSSGHQQNETVSKDENTVTEKPVSATEPTTAPTTEPTSTPKPTPTPTPKPTKTPKPTPTPTPKPTKTPKPTQTPKPTAKPTSSPRTNGSSCNYILNKNTKVFHYPGCSSVKQMNESNKIYFNGTRQQAIDKGYRPCGRCNP